MFFRPEPTLSTPPPVQVTTSQSPTDETVQSEAFPQDLISVSAHSGARDSKPLDQDFPYDVARNTE
jgi:hypothetical protein